MTNKDSNCLVLYCGSQLLQQLSMNLTSQDSCALPLGWACDLLQPTKCSPSDVTQVLKLSLKKAWQLLLWHSQNPPRSLATLLQQTMWKDQVEGLWNRRGLDNTWRRTEEPIQRRIKAGAPDLWPVESHTSWAPHLQVKSPPWMFLLCVVWIPDPRNCEKIKFILSH